MKTSNVVLLLVVLVLILGGVAFLQQWVGGRTPDADDIAKEEKGQEVPIKFVDVPTTYPTECEVGREGYFDFAYENTSRVPLAFGLDDRSCTCSHIQIMAVTPEEKKRFAKWPPDEDTKDEAGLLNRADRWQTVDPGQSVNVDGTLDGLLRVAWKPKKLGAQRLTAEMWFQEQGKAQTKAYKRMEVTVTFVPALQLVPATFLTEKPDPVRELPHQADVGDVGPGARRVIDFVGWSSTRDHFQAQARMEEPDPCFACRVTPLTPAECKLLESGLRDRRNLKTRVRCGERIQVTMSERLPDGTQMDLGPFKRKVHVSGDDDFQDTLEVVGVVRGEIMLASPDDKDVVRLGAFAAVDGTTRTVPIETTQPGMRLAVEGCKPAFLQAEVSPDARKSSTGGTRWLLKVTVPPDKGLGQFPRGSKIVLKTTDKKPRRFIIPVTGNAVQR